MRSGEKPLRGWKELLFGECGDHGPETRRGSRAATETLSADLGRHPPEFPELRAPRGSPGSRRSSIQFSHPAPTRGVRRQQQGPCRGGAGHLLREGVPGPPAGRQGRARARRLQTRRGAARGYGPVDGYLGCRGQEQLSRGAQHLNRELNDIAGPRGGSPGRGGRRCPGLGEWSWLIQGGAGRHARLG